jgi:hypothetical protein
MFMSTITLKSRITNNNTYYQPMKKSHIHLKSPGIYVQNFSNNIIHCHVQGAPELRVLILTSGRTRQFKKLFSITFCKICKSFPRFCVPYFLPNESFCVINWSLFFCNHENFNFNYIFNFFITM